MPKIVWHTVCSAPHTPLMGGGGPAVPPQWGVLPFPPPAQGVGLGSTVYTCTLDGRDGRVAVEDTEHSYSKEQQYTQ